MNESEKRDLIEGYMRQLARALDDIPADARRDLMEDIRNHIEEAWEASPEKSRAALLNVLERLGAPEQLAAEQRERLGLGPVSPTKSIGILEIAAVVLTALFWPVGVLLAWLSPCWRTHDKLIATALPVLGLILFISVSIPAYTSGPVVAVSEHTAQVGEGGSAETEAPRPVSVMPDEMRRIAFVEIMALYGILGAPLTAAILLAWRLRQDSAPCQASGNRASNPSLSSP